MLLNLTDGGIEDIYYESDGWGGCETCDYGSNYINEFEIKMTTGIIKIKVSQMYDYLLSEGYMMRLFLQNATEIESMTEDKFFEWLKEHVKYEIENGENRWSDGSLDLAEFEKFK